MILGLDDHDWVVREECARCLSGLGQEGVVLLSEALPHASDRARRQIAIALGEIGLEAPIAVPALLDRVANDTKSSVRAASTWALIQLGPRESDVPALIALLARPELEPKYMAIAILQSMVNRAKEAVSALKGLTNEPGDLGRAAKKALSAVQGR